MYKQVFDKSNGNPKLIENDEFDASVYTDVAPEDGLYRPIYFDGNKWIGTPYEEWLAKQPKPEPVEPNPIEKATANLQMQLMKSNIAQNQLQKQNAQMMLEIAKLKGGN